MISLEKNLAKNMPPSCEHKLHQFSDRYLFYSPEIHRTLGLMSEGLTLSDTCYRRKRLIPYLIGKEKYRIKAYKPKSLTMVNSEQKVGKMQCKRTLRSHSSIVFSQVAEEDSDNTLSISQTVLAQLKAEVVLFGSLTELNAIA